MKGFFLQSPSTSRLQRQQSWEVAQGMLEATARSALNFGYIYIYIYGFRA